MNDPWKLRLSATASAGSDQLGPPNWRGQARTPARRAAHPLNPLIPLETLRLQAIDRRRASLLASVPSL